jgi:metallo-beta-lactamase family protein
VEFSIHNRKVVFTGDLGNSPSLLLRDTEVIDDAEYMVMESVYGDRNHESGAERDETLAKTLVDTVTRGGTVVIPAFSIERTQVLLYSIGKLFDNGRLPNVPVFLDSPLALKVTRVYEENTALMNDGARAYASTHELFSFKNLVTIRSPLESAAIHDTKGPKIILAGSGMSVGGRVISHEKYYLGDANSTILFVGYQAPGSLGRRIADGQKNVVIEGVPITIRAHIAQIDGFSAHKDSDHLLEFVSHSTKTLKKVFICMGEPKSETFLAQKIRDNLGLDAVVPEQGSSANLV